MTPNQSAITPLLTVKTHAQVVIHYNIKGAYMQNKEKISHCESHNQTWKAKRLTGSKRRKINITKGLFPHEYFNMSSSNNPKFVEISISMGPVRCGSRISRGKRGSNVVS